MPFTQISNLDIVQIKQDIAELFSQVTIKDKIPNRKKRTKNPKQPELLATMKCKNQCCPVRYKVLRIGNNFGYYSNHDVHKHVENPKLLPEGVQLLIEKNYLLPRAPTMIMSMLQNIEDIPTLIATLGEERKDALLSVSSSEKLRNQIESSVRYKRKIYMKEKVNRNVSNKGSRTIADAQNDIKKNMIDLKAMFGTHGSNLSIEQIMELLPGDRRKETGSFYTHSDLGQNDSLQYSSVQWISKQAFATARAAIDMCENSGIPILLCLDYTHSKMKKSKSVLGMIGIPDLWKQFHSMGFDYNRTKNFDGAELLVESTVFVLKLAGYKLEKHGPLHAIMDGSISLKNACEKYAIITKRCFVHLIRAPDKSIGGKKGFSGTAGSLYVYLNGKGLDDKTIFIIRLVYYSIAMIPSTRRSAYDIVRAIFLHDFDHGYFYGVSITARNSMRRHFFSFYLPEDPAFGFIGSVPGHPKDTNWYVSFHFYPILLLCIVIDSATHIHF